MMDVARRESGIRIRKRDVVFLTAKLGSSRESTKSENHSSSKILAIYKRLKTEIYGKSHKSSQPKEEHGGFLSGVERKHKNERTATRQQRFTTTLRAVFSPCHAVLTAPASHGPKRKPIPFSHADSSQRPTATRSPIDGNSKELEEKRKQRPTFSRFSPAKSRNVLAFSLRG